MASASVAQVHAAVLHDGTDVVVKVRRPGVVSTVAADASYLLPALMVAELSNERLRLANLRGIVELMIRLFAQEVDLRLEATNIVEMALAFERAGLDVEVPAPIPGLVTKRAMVMERVDGVSTADMDAVTAYGHVAADLVRLAIVAVLETTFVDGIFHGDLHPGNVFVTERGLALLDFGIVGRLSTTQRMSLVRLITSGMEEDQTGVVQALKDFGALPDDADAIGSGSHDRSSRSTLARRSTPAIATLDAGGTASRHPANGSVIQSGASPLVVEISWPSFT
jgi:ubiquinone biosynthesis protein